MTVLEGLIQSANTGLAGTDYTFVDADTLKKGDKSYRIQGVNAPEVEKFVRGEYKTGTAGGQAATDTLRGLANSQGFTNISPILDRDGNPVVDQFGRELVDLKNEKGESFKNKILSEGILDANRYTTNEDRLSSELGQLRRDQARLAGEETNTEWDQARHRLEGAMLAEGAESLGFKRAAVDEATLSRMDQALKSRGGAGRYYSLDNVQFRDYDRNMKNESMNPFSDNWEQGWIGVRESAYGMMNMLGETTGSEWAADIGEAGVERARTEIQDYGTSLKDWRKVDGFGDAISYVTNNAALSLPYMGISMGGALLAPVTGGASLAAPASIYAGQTWNEMEGDNKNAAVAIGSGVAQATLDRLGLSFIFKTGVGPTSLLKEATEELVRRGATREAAEQTVMNASRKELAGFVGDAAEVAKRQITGKQIFKQAAKAGGVGVLGEGATEAMQEATGYTAAHWTGEGFDFEDLTSRMLDGAIAGAALGGAFSVPGSIYDAGAWADVAVRQAPADAQRLSTAGKYAEQEQALHGRVMSNEENAAQARALAMARPANYYPTLNERADADKRRRRDRSFSDAFFDTIVSTPALWRGATRNIFTDDIKARSRAARVAADMFGGGLQKTFSGATYENAKHHAVTIYKNMVPTPDETFAAFNNGKRTGSKQREKISKEIYNALRGATSPDGVFNPDLIPDANPRKAQIIELHSQMNRLSDKMHSDQAKYNPDLGYINNYLTRYKSFDKKKIYDNKPAFVQKLMSEFNMSEVDATKIADSITDHPDINDIGDALTAHGAAGNPGSHRQRTLNLSENPEFDQFMEQDLFRNINNAARSAARYTAYEQYVGKNHEVLNELLSQMEADGLSPDEVNKIAAQMKDYLDAESGNYKRPDSAAGKRLQDVQRSFMMITTIAGLPLATVSSFVEMALSMKALTLDQIMGKGNKPGGLYHMGNELGQTLWTGVKEIGSLATSKQHMPAATQGKEMLKSMGYYDWNVGAATTTGVTEIKPWQQYIYESLFKWNGLQGWTNYTRAIRAAMAGDYLVDKLDIVLRNEGTNETQEAREALRNLGVNVDDMLEAYRGDGMFDPNSAQVVENNFREGTFNFINDAVALPQSANRPLIYQDPRFALFTQFQGFMATFTANHIPKLWGEYVSRGTPAMKYNAFAVMTTMIMLGFASQYLKDLIKYGQAREFGPDDHPYLDRSEYLQRGVRASGLLGTGERVLDQFFPLYEQRSDNAGEWLFNGVTGESPALGYAKAALEGIGAGLTGDVGKAAKTGVKFTPLGPLNFVRDFAESKADAWNFNGE